MKLGANEIQAWAWGLLNGDSEITTTHGATVTADPDKDTGFPRVVLDDSDDQDWSTHDTPGTDHALRVSAWVKDERSWEKVNAIASRILELLVTNEAVALTGFTLTGVTLSSVARNRNQADGTKQVALELTVLTEEG